jgi:hypothetical protein
MSFSILRRSMPQRFSLVLTSFLQKPGLAFADVLPEERIQQSLTTKTLPSRKRTMKFTHRR